MPRVSRSAKPQSAVTWVAACLTDTQMRAGGGTTRFFLFRRGSHARPLRNRVYVMGFLRWR